MHKNLLSRLLLTPQQTIEQHTNKRDGMPAGVLIPLRLQDWGWELILTRRSASLRHHPSQVAFPGGKPEPEDTNLADTALRETHEELGIEPEYVSIVSQMPSLNTHSGFRITPYIGILRPGYQIRPNPREVESVLPLALRPFLNTSNYQNLTVKRGNKHIKVHFINQDKTLIWGATARVLYHLAELELAH